MYFAAGVGAGIVIGQPMNRNNESQEVRIFVIHLFEARKPYYLALFVVRQAAHVLLLCMAFRRR